MWLKKMIFYILLFFLFFFFPFCEMVSTVTLQLMELMQCLYSIMIKNYFHFFFKKNLLRQNKMASGTILLLLVLVQGQPQSECLPVSGDERCTVCYFIQPPTDCDNITVIQSEPEGRVVCKGGICEGAKFQCTGDCSIQCSDKDTCKDISIECSPGAKCNLHCSGTGACSGTVVAPVVAVCAPDDACSPDLLKLTVDSSDSNSFLIIILVVLSCLLLCFACLAFYLCKRKSPPPPPAPIVYYAAPTNFRKQLPEELNSPEIPPPTKRFITVPTEVKEVKAAVDWHPSCEWSDNYLMGCGKPAQVISEDVDDATVLLRFNDMDSEAWYPMALFNEDDWRAQFPGSPWISNSIGRGYTYRIQKSIRESGGSSYPFSKGYTLNDKPDAPWV